MRHIVTPLTTVLAVIVAGSGRLSASGEPIAARLLTPSVLPGEPVVVDVVLGVDDLMRDSTGPTEAAGKPLRLHPRFTGVLHRDGVPICDFPIFGQKSGLSPVDAGHYGTTVVGFIVVGDHNGKNLTFVADPGEYALTVRDAENSSPSPSPEEKLVIRQPAEADAAAWAIYRETNVLQVILELSEQGGDDATVQVLARIAKEHPETAYGRYAAVSAALRKLKTAEKERARADDAQVWDAVLADLGRAAALLIPEHPWREELLFRQAVIQARGARYAEARALVEKLKTEFPRGAFAGDVASLGHELSKRK